MHASPSAAISAGVRGTCGFTSRAVIPLTATSMMQASITAPECFNCRARGTVNPSHMASVARLHPDRPGRNETALERCDRNLVELLQEVRVVQTGVQVLFAFLLT